jgi:hypothetical protein
MAAFDPSSRVVKKRRIMVDEPISVFSRVQRTVTQAVYGKPSSPKINGEVSDREEREHVEVRQEDSEGKRSVRRTDNARTVVESRSGEDSTTDALDNESRQGRITNSRENLRKRSQENVNIGNGSSGIVEDTTEVQTPSRKRRKRFKGWAYADATDELAQGGAPNSTHLDSGNGRVKKRRDDLSIDINPHQLKLKQSLDTINGAMVEKDSTEDHTIGRARRTSRRTETREDQGSQVKPVAKFNTPRKKGRRKKSSTDVLVLPDAGHHGGQGLETNVSEDVFSDELAQGSQGEESRLGELVQTPVRMPKKTRKAEFVSAEKESVPIPASFVAPPQPEIIFDPQAPLDGHAQALQDMLSGDPEALTKPKTHILSGLTGRRRLPLMNIEDEEMKVKQLVEQTVLAGEGNSMLIIGSRGSGKTSLVETILSTLASDHRDDFHVVRLSGFIHTDDKLALREIWRQLGREMDVEDDDLGGRSNYADTLTSLLALLAHPALEDDDATTARSVVFVLDEFDLFASHPRQTLLYNLFDVAQSRNAPIAVLGLTTKVNVVDSLEKRVKSRFGQRYVHLSLPKSFSTYQDICLSALSYHPSTHDLLQQNKTDLHHLSKTWNDYISTLFTTPPFQHFLRTLYTTTKSIPAFLNASLLPISTLTPTTLPTPSSFTTHTLLPPDSKLALLPSLSTLALALLIAAARLDIILDTDVCTFGMAYDEYVTLASKSKMQSSAAGQMAVGGGARVWSKVLAKGAWEDLGELELVLPAVGGGRGGGGKGEMWRVDVGLEEIGGWLEGESGRGGALGRWCREI